MRVGHLDCSSGASGDMFLGALVDAGASLERLQDAVDTLGVGDVRLTWARVRRAGITATAVRVRAPQETPPVRTFRHIRRIIEFAALVPGVRDRALSVFRRIAEVEAAVHGVDVDEVHFHEIGALDTLADVVGASVALDELGLDRLTCGPIATGTGTVETAHGGLPIPVPAVVALLEGFTLVGRDVAAELVTPTGAALLAEFATPVPTMPPLTLERTGVGAGGRDLEHPNVLRLLVGTPAGHDAELPAPRVRLGDDVETDRGDEVQELLQLEATVDDLSPELVPLVLDRLREAGAFDAWATPVLMKKGRPGFTLHALSPAESLGRLREVLFRESTTIGCRWWPVERVALPRSEVTVRVDGHDVRVKVARHGGVVVSVAPEADDVRSVADATGRPAREIAEDARTAATAEVAD